MAIVENVARAWAPGTDFPDPNKVNGLYYWGLVTISIMWSLALITVGLRIWARRTAKQLAVDDYLILAAMAVNTGWFYTLIMYVKTCYVGIHYWHVPELNLEQQASAKLYEWLIILLYHPILGFVKASVLAFDTRFTGLNKGLKYTVYTLQAINAGCMISVFCVTLFQCNPISLNWEPGYRRACIDNMAFNYAYNAIVIATDVAVLAVPVWAFIGLQMQTRLKIALIGVFALGGIVTIISCIRLANLVEFFNQFYAGTMSPDLYYSFGWALSPIECNLAIIAASMPALWPLLRKAFPGVFTDINTSYRGGTSGHAASASRGHFRSNVSRPHTMGVSRLDDDDSDDVFSMKPMHNNDCRATTPTGSQDGIIDPKGIMCTTDVEIDYEDAANQGRKGGGHDGYGRKKVAYAV